MIYIQYHSYLADTNKANYKMFCYKNTLLLSKIDNNESLSMAIKSCKVKNAENFIRLYFVPYLIRFTSGLWCFSIHRLLH